MLKCNCGGSIYSYKTLDTIVSGVQVVLRYKKCSRCGKSYQSIERIVNSNGDVASEKVTEKKE